MGNVTEILEVAEKLDIRQQLSLLEQLAHLIGKNKTPQRQ
jgi:hypothetical protein